MKLQRMVARALLMSAGLALTATRADAAFLVITESVTASGSLGGVAFDSRLVTVTETIDTAAVVAIGGGTYNSGLGTIAITVAGFGSGTISGTAFSASTLRPAVVGLGAMSDVNSFDLLDVINASAAGYRLDRPIGPFSGAALISSGIVFATSGGEFVLDSTIGVATFQAAAVPEPSSLVLCGLATVAGLGLGLARSRAIGSGKRRG